MIVLHRSWCDVDLVTDYPIETFFDNDHVITIVDGSAQPSHVSAIKTVELDISEGREDLVSSRDRPAND